MSVTYDSRKDHQHLLQSFALLTKLKDNDGAGDLLNFIHTINQGPKRRTGGVLSRISGLTRSCRSGSSMGSFPEIELDELQSTPVSTPALVHQGDIGSNDDDVSQYSSSNAPATDAASDNAVTVIVELDGNRGSL